MEAVTLDSFVIKRRIYRDLGNIADGAKGTAYILMC